MTNLLKWELWGIAVIFVAGTLLHFLFDWTGQFVPVGILAAVNESVWEHLKLAFWPALFYSFIVYWAAGKGYPAFISSKAAGILLMPLLIVVLHYSYRSLLGRHIVLVDILIFALAAAAGQMVSYRLTAAYRTPGGWMKLFIPAAAVFAICLGLFTFYPPKWPIFRDGQSGRYGIWEMRASNAANRRVTDSTDHR